MTTLLRFPDLVERGICHNREMLRVLVRDHAFPTGHFLTPNRKVWTEQEVEKWVASRIGRVVEAA